MVYRSSVSLPWQLEDLLPHSLKRTHRTDVCDLACIRVANSLLLLLEVPPPRIVQQFPPPLQVRVVSETSGKLLLNLYPLNLRHSLAMLHHPLQLEILVHDKRIAAAERR